MAKENENRYTVPMLVKVMEMLEILAKGGQGMTLQELHNSMSYSKSTLFRILTTLHELGYVNKDEAGKFFITKKLFNLGVAALGEENLVEIALEPMISLRNEVKESVMLGALIEDKVVLLEQVLGSHSFTFTIKTGTRIHLHTSAPGKVLFAAQNSQRKRAILSKMSFERFNENTITEPEKFIKEAEKTLSKGYGIDIEEELFGVYCIGAPIYNRYGNAIACVWITAPKGRLSIDHLDDVGAIIKKYTHEISVKLGYTESI